jgi:serine/tyrosine/threonine adenylyltransferase
MNAPVPPPLPPLAPCPAPGSAPRVGLPGGVDPGDWQPGLAALPHDPAEPFTRACDPLPLPEPQFMALSPSAAALLGLTDEQIRQDPIWHSLLSGGAALTHIQPYAAVYAGHQFGHFVPRLGDGRALNLGSLRGWELQLKGAGPTPYSRFADGRAVLRSSIREFLCSEAMHALGIPTTRALSLVTSPAPVIRETVETAAVVCRLAPSFLRFGSFEYFAAQGRHDLVQQLVRQAATQLQITAGDAQITADTSVQITAGDAQTAADTSAVSVLAIKMLEEVSRRTARLMSQWMGVGFMHGVMNTDNFSVLGLTIDYGPFGFMDAFDAGHICNHTDQGGRYSYQAQPSVGLWNVAKLATSLTGLVSDTQALQGALEIYKAEFERSMQSILKAKFGLEGLAGEEWDALLDDFYRLMHEHRLDYTLTFRALAQDNDSAMLDLAVDRQAVAPWLARYRQAAAKSLQALGESASDRQARMNQVNPKFILRNWVAEEVIRTASQEGDTRVFEEVFTLLQRPFEEHPALARYAAAPPDWAQGLSVSCSS